jgi:amyloid beta precursor protein binding protein 1
MATTDKYDRQLRLWGAQGQRALMQSHILLINADATGTEALKNLVLPGVGHFTVLDSENVSYCDIGSNFFVDAKSLGRPRAEVVVALLNEMNPDVVGHHLIGEIQEILETGRLKDSTFYSFKLIQNKIICKYLSDPYFLSSFSLIITANLPESILLPIAHICYRDGIPLIATHSYGLIGYVRLQVNSHEIIESRPDPAQSDLRISNPFPSLTEYCSSFCFDSLDSSEFAHVPFIVILFKAIQMWKANVRIMY